MEELLTQADPQEARAVGAALRPPCARPAGAVRGLGPVRGDFVPRLAELPGLADELGRSLYILQPLQGGALREAITLPARRGGCAFESEALVEALLREDTSLPLLSFAL